MTKKILVLFLLLALGAGLYAMSANAKGQGSAVPTQKTQPSQTVKNLTKVNLCKVITGVDGGNVNLRTCAGTSCAVMKVLTEGESLDILTAGLWAKVTTADGVTGYINSLYCKKDK